MGVRWLGLVVAIVILPSVLALCQVSEPTGDDTLLNAIYSSDGINYGTDLLTPTPPATVDVERNAAIITDPGSGTYRVVDLPSQAIDVEKTPLFIKNKSIQEGPFFIAGILDDTLRVAKGEAYDYGYGLKLHDRYEGRAEVNPISTRSDVSQFLSTLLGILSQPRIRNVLRTEDFTVTITCASSLCDKRAYSLFTRLMNLGASAEMFTEWFGMAAFSFFLPKEWKLKITEEVKDIKFKLAEKIENHRTLRRLLRLPTADELLDQTLRKLDDETKGMLAMAIAEGEAFNLHRIPVGQETVDLATYLASLDVEKRCAFLQAVDALSVKLERVKTILSSKEGKIDDAIKELQGLEGKLLFGAGEGTKDVIEDIVKELEYAKEYAAPDTYSKIVKHYDAILKNLRTVREEAAKTLPLTSTLSEVVRDYVARGIEPRTEKGRALLREWIAPMFYYLIKRGLAPVEQIPGLAAPTPGFLGFVSFGWRVSEPYPIPAEWRTITIRPAESYEYGDAFVDFIINKGVDPGDAFKSLVSITPVCLIGQYWEHQQGSAPPFLSELCVTQRSERVYEPKEAILGLGVASSTCPTCSLSIKNNAVMLDVGGATASAFLLENSREDEGSLSVAFAHHTNIKMGDEAELDLDEAKQKGETCMQKCPIIRNPFYTLGGLVKDPRGAMFVASTIQSLVYVAPLPIAVLVDMAILSPQAAECHACVDDVGGYYLHIFAPHTDTATLVPSPEGSLSSAVDEIISAFSLDENSVLAKKLEEFKEYLKTSEVKKEAVISNILLNRMGTGELKFSAILVFWSKAEEMVPTGLRNQQGVDVKTQGGMFSIDTDRGELRFNETPIMQGDRVRLYVINNRIPGIVFPGKLVYTSFSGEAFRASSRKDYTFLDPTFVSCVSKAFGCENLKECFGDLLEIHTDTGVIKAKDKGLDILGDEALAGTQVRIVGYNVTATAADFVAERNADGIASISFSSKDVNMGYLNSIVFENGFVIRDGDKLIVWIEVLNAVPAGAVDAVHLDWNAASQGMDVSLVPSPDASEEEMAAIERMNKLLDEIQPIRAIDAEKTAVAIVKDENGNLWLRVYDKDANVLRTDLMRNAQELLSTLVSMPSTIKLIETNTWTLRIYRDEKGQMHVQFTSYDGNAWDEKLLSVVRDPEDPMAVKFITESGEHILRARYENGQLVLSFDGLEGYVTKITGASVVNELIRSVSQDPEDPNKLLVETEKGKHVVEIKVSKDGTPYLTLDGENKGMVNTIQGANGFLWFDPTEGWKLVNGALLPLADAFKNGIKIAIGADGLVHGEPSSGVVVLTSGQQGQQGLVLPFFEGWEKVVVILSLAAVLFVLSLRVRG